MKSEDIIGEGQIGIGLRSNPDMVRDSQQERYCTVV